MLEGLIKFLKFLLGYKDKTKYSHTWRRKSAIATLEKIKTFPHPGQVFEYLRKIDPFVFEELILHAIEHREDIEIIRNDRYTGDNGIDGRFKLTKVIDGKKKQRLYLVQAKRYSQHINAKDVEKFRNQIKEEKAYGGLFVHTGKSGKEVYNYLSSGSNIRLVSGKKLIDLFVFGRL